MKPNPAPNRLRAALLILAAVGLATPALALNGKQWRNVAKALSIGKDVRVEQLAIKVTPGSDVAQPLGLRVPATGIAAPAICGVINGKFECVSVVSLSCPSNIQLVQEGTNAIFNCNTSCEPSTPDDEGYCDCEIDYGSCTAA